MKISGLRFFLVCLLSSIAAAPAQPPVTDLAEGRSLIARLSPRTSPDPTADQAIFRGVGTARSNQLLVAVVTHGFDPAATTEDWTEMHRAYDALVELYVGDQQYFKAAIFAGMQDFSYRHFEGDYASAVTAARQALDLQQRAGQGAAATLAIPWENLGEELFHIGRIDEGLAALYQAHTIVQDPTSSFAAHIWTKIISLESARGNSVAAHTEADAFLRAADPSTPQGFRAAALLASANVAIDEHRYDDAAARVHEAMAAAKGIDDANLINLEAYNVVLTLGLEAMKTLPLDQAITLCNRIDGEFGGRSRALPAL